METMRSQMRSFEFPLFNGRAQNPDLGEITDRYNYQFSHTGSTDKLNPDQEYTLRHEGCEYLIRVTAVNVGALQLQCAEQIRINAKGHTLVIDPWFLYEKLLDALTSLSPEQNIDNALRLFGRLPTTPLNLSPQLDHGELNESQQRAIALCCQKNPNLGVGSTRYGQNPAPWRPISRVVASRQTHPRHINHQRGGRPSPRPAVGTSGWAHLLR